MQNTPCFKIRDFFSKKKPAEMNTDCRNLTAVGFDFGRGLWGPGPPGSVVLGSNTCKFHATWITWSNVTPSNTQFKSGFLSFPTKVEVS